MHTKKLGILMGLRKLCQGAVIFGFVTSAGGNILHAVNIWTGDSVAYLIISIVIAVLIPVIFGWMFEIATRVTFRREANMIMKVIAFLGAAGISSVTAWNSYFHQRDAFSHFGDHTQAVLLPLAIDGLMIIGSVYLIELGFQIRDIEAFIASGEVKKIKDTEVPQAKIKAPSKRERIAALLAQSPEISIQELAKRTGSSYNYASVLAKELRAGNGAELVAA